MFSAKQMFTNLSIWGWQQTQKLLADDLASGDQFGYSVSLSADGNTALIGAPFEDTSPNTDNGAAYVYTWDGSTWTQEAKLLASDVTSDDYFGWSVSLSRDGNTALIGAYRAGLQHGQSYVFTRSGGTWTQQAIFYGTGNVLRSSQAGYSVSLSGDGNTALIGAPNYTGIGAVYVYTRSGTTWTQQTLLLPSIGSSGGRFGWSVSLSYSGDVAAIGQPLSDRVYVFTRSGTTWTEQGRLSGSGQFGRSVSLHSGGSRLLVGADGDSTLPYNANGAAYYFDRTTTTWIQRAKLLASDMESGDRFGYSVSYGGSATGDAAVIGAYGVGSGGSGAAYVFTRSGTTWTEEAKLMASDPGTSDRLGWSVSIGGNNNTAVVGAYQEDTPPFTDNGAAYVFVNI